MQFADLALADPILEALKTEGYETATPIQAKAIPHVLSGRDVLGSAQTGTGKTAAFALPILNRLFTHPPTQTTGPRKIRVLVLAPTRELAAQIAAGFKAYGRNVRWARYTVIFGGVGQNPQVSSLKSGVDVVIATPGRLLDLMNQGHVDLSGVDTLVLDEADRMLDMGFIHDIRKIVAKVPHKRQTLFFSATMPPEIRKLADTILKDAVTVAVAPVSQVADRIDESVYMVEKTRKPQLLAHLIKDLPMHRAIVFTRTKHGADKVVRKLHAFKIPAAAIHGNKSQNNRNRALHDFKTDKIGVLVATDIAARGIDIDDVTHVVNFDVTHEPETYVHRIGRTARAGASGHAISFCDRDERSNLTAIERLIKRKIEVVETPLDELPPAPPETHAERERDRDRERDDRGGRGVRRSDGRRPAHAGGGHGGSHGGGHGGGGRPSGPHSGSTHFTGGQRQDFAGRTAGHRPAAHRPSAPRPATPAARHTSSEDTGPVRAYPSALTPSRPAHPHKPHAAKPSHTAHAPRPSGGGHASHASHGSRPANKPHHKGPLTRGTGGVVVRSKPAGGGHRGR